MGKGKKDGPPKKRGNRSDVVGLRAEHLHAELDNYCTASAAGTTRTWYPKLFKSYWEKFPWEIPFNQDPTEDALANVTADSALTAEQKAEKKKVVADTEVKIKRWFNYQRSHSGTGINPWMKFLRADLKPTEERRPRRLLDYQVYMQDEEKNAAINSAMAERYPDKVGAKDSIKWRAQLARELLAAEPEEVQDEFRLKGEEEYEEAMEEYQKNEGGGANMEDFDEDARAEARARLVATVKPLLLSIRKLTGYQVTMLVGGVINGKVEVRSVHGGTVDGKNEDGPEGIDFTRWDPQGYKPFMKHFMRYIAAANGTPQAVEGPSASTAPEGSSSSASAMAPSGESPGSTIPPTAPLPPLPPSSHPPAMPSMPAPPPARSFSVTPPPCSELVNARSAAGPKAPGPSGDEEGGIEMDIDHAGDVDANVERGFGVREKTPAVREKTPAEFAGLSIASPLRRSVMELTPESRRLKIGRLGRLSEWDLAREENMARNKEILASQRITDEGGVGGTKNKRAKVDGADEDDYSDAGESGSDSDENDGAEREGTPTPRTTRGGGRGGGRAAAGGAKGRKKGKGQGQAVVVGDDNVPKWAADAHVTLLAGGGGEVWTKLVNLWWDYEKAASFLGPAKGKGTAIRPKEVSGWISRARTGGPSPAIIDVCSFAARWWAWWVEINPVWRPRTSVGVKRLAKEGDGDWGSVASTGPNGMLNILICLRWWYDALGGDEGGRTEWKEALEDVVWALERICVPAAGGEEETEI
ncbi:hypothetical protein C8F04DRAFT_1250861 [Mycena alexandri]|uniref:Uncharacterized protein n=1 Tax=Mycena alexandri TaxID=1745969 RepID=A0AAD6X8W0_9AGAR|nr:hypothetical protein C8F04DRAFT_1250861 [Mycena alexandri]